MGCDIYPEIQVYDQDTKKWVVDQYPFLGDFETRNYCYFTILANVRSKHGLPSLSARKGRAGNTYQDFHSYSYLTLYELLGKDKNSWVFKKEIQDWWVVEDGCLEQKYDVDNFWDIQFLIENTWDCDPPEDKVVVLKEEYSWIYEMILKLKAYYQEYDEKHVRLVFCFDS